MTELKTCPKCNSENVRAGVSDDKFLPDWYHGYVWCADCGITIKRPDETFEKAKRRAVEAWNTRHERTCDGCVWWSPHEPIGWTCLACSRHYKDNYETMRANDADQR